MKTKPSRIWRIILALTSALSSAQALSAESIDAQEPRLEIGGSFETSYSISGSRSDSPVLRLQYFGKTIPELLSSYPLVLGLNGDYQTGELGFHVRTTTTVTNGDQVGLSLPELYGQYFASDSVSFAFGKKTFKWGKGYAFNPVGYLSPAKDPENPDLALEGVPALAWQYSRSFRAAPIDNVTLDLIVLPAGGAMTAKAYDLMNTGIAGKLYFLAWDTDLDFLASYRKDEPLKFGMDFSRNLSPALEVHGELSRFQDVPKYSVGSATLRTETVSGFSYLAGLRWINAWNMTTVLEYYHDDAGLTKAEYADYIAYLGKTVSSATIGSAAQALSMTNQHFSSPNPMGDYLYLKISRPEPFGLVDSSVSLYSIFNMLDQSASIGLLLSYKPVSNLETVFQPVALVGAEGTEYGAKQYLYKASLLAKVSF